VHVPGAGCGKVRWEHHVGTAPPTLPLPCTFVSPSKGPHLDPVREAEGVAGPLAVVAMFEAEPAKHPVWRVMRSV